MQNYQNLPMSSADRLIFSNIVANHIRNSGGHDMSVPLVVQASVQPAQIIDLHKPRIKKHQLGNSVYNMFSNIHSRMKTHKVPDLINLPNKNGNSTLNDIGARVVRASPETNNTEFILIKDADFIKLPEVENAVQETPNMTQMAQPNQTQLIKQQKGMPLRAQTEKTQLIKQHKEMPLRAQTEKTQLIKQHKEMPLKAQTEKTQLIKQHKEMPLTAQTEKTQTQTKMPLKKKLQKPVQIQTQATQSTQTQASQSTQTQTAPLKLSKKQKRTQLTVQSGSQARTQTAAVPQKNSEAKKNAETQTNAERQLVPKAPKTKQLCAAKKSAKKNNIAQAKASWQQKTQQRLRREIVNGENCTTRIMEVMRQKKILQDLLTEQQRVNRDRQNIAFEVKTMRNYLTEIREKLDHSLQKLSSTHDRSPRLRKKPSLQTTTTRKTTISSNARRAVSKSNASLPKPK